MSENVTPSTRGAPSVRIVWSMNDHGAMTVRVEDADEVRQVVEYESTTLRKTLEQLPADTTVPLEMESVGTRGNAWRAVGLSDGSAERDSTPARPECSAEQKYRLQGETPEHNDPAKV